MAHRMRDEGSGSSSFVVGQRVRVVQRGALLFGGVKMVGNTFEGVTIARKNPDGSYGIKGMVSTPDTDIVDVPLEWIEPL